MSDTSPMLPEVRADFPSFTARFEGRISWMYCDIKGLVTTGVGNLIDPESLAAPLPWLHADGSAATQDEVLAEWQRVKAMGGGLVASRYQADTGLHLSDDAIDALVLSHLDRDAQVLAQTFPDFSTFPAAAQTAILSMAWAMGSGFPTKWPNFSAAVRAHDWATCAATCAINTTGNPGVAPRNAANQQLFLDAAAAGGGTPTANGAAPAAAADTAAASGPTAAGPPVAAANMTDVAPMSGDDVTTDEVTAAAGASALGFLMAAALGVGAAWYWRREIGAVLESVSAPVPFTLPRPGTSRSAA